MLVNKVPRARTELRELSKRHYAKILKFKLRHPESAFPSSVACLRVMQTINKNKNKNGRSLGTHIVQVSWVSELWKYQNNVFEKLKFAPSTLISQDSTPRGINQD